MDILATLRRDLRGRSLRDFRSAAAAMGVPYSTLRKIVDEDTTDPRYATVEKIRAYYEAVKPAREAREAAVHALS